MSQHDASARPSQVTVAGWTVAVASAVVVLAVWQTMGQLHSLDLRDQLTTFLTSGSGQGLGLDVDDLIEVVRWALYVTGVAAVASAILGVYVLRRDKAARIGISVAAVPIVLTSPLAGSLPGLLVGAGAAMLWTAPARDWFAGRPVRPTSSRLAFRASQPGRPRSAGRPAPPPAQPPAQPPAEPAVPRPDLGSAPAQLPPPTRSFGRVGAAGSPAGSPPDPGPLDFPPPASAPVHPTLAPPAPTDLPRADWAPVMAAAGPGRAAIPGRVRLACWLTWVFAAVTALGALASIVVVLLDDDALIEEVTSSDAWRPSMDQSLIVPATVTLAVAVVLWCLIAAVLAVFAWRGLPWAWTLLIVSTAVAALVSMLAVPASAAHLVATALCLGMLLHRDVRGWYARAPRSSRLGR